MAISAVIITKNEEANIARCISSLQQVAKEIILVDAYSSDNTVAIAKELSAIVVQEKWKGYGYNKNLGNQLATNDWILSIDADEVLSPELIATLQELVLEKNKVYAINRLVNYGGQWVRHSGWHPDWKVRLFHRSTAHWDEVAMVHEQLLYPSSMSTEQLAGSLYHFSYKDSDDHWRRIERYAQLSAQQLAQQGKRATFLKLYLSPIARFIRTYFFKRGFLDGALGWRISCRNAYLVYRKYDLLRKGEYQADN